MKVIIVTVLITVCSAANLDRSYLPPASAKTAGGSSDILQTPNLELPVGSYENEHHGVVVDAVVGTRTSNPGQSGLGASRPSYGSTNSKVGEAAFRDKHLQGGPSYLPQGFVDFNRPERVQAMRDRVANIIRIENNLRHDSYNYLYQTDNGISAGEKAIAVNGVRAEGGYSYTGDDGQVYTVTYTADENGYKPKGDHLPTPPPIPAEILEALRQNAKDEAAGLIDDGSYDAQKYNTEGDYSESSDNDRYNDRQSNTFVNRPESNVPSSFFNNQFQALKPNFGFDAFIVNKEDQKTYTPFRPESTLLQDNLNKPTVTQSSLYTDIHIGESKPSQNSMNKEYSVPFSQPFDEHTDVIAGNDDKSAQQQETGIPLSQQSLQNVDKQNFQSSSKPTSYDSTSTIQDSISNVYIQEAFAPQSNFGNNRLTTVPSEARPTTTNLDNFGDLNEEIKGTNSLDTISSGQIVLPTTQPPRELTTPFEMDFMSNLDTDRKRINIFLPSFGAATATPPRFEDFIKKQQNDIQESDLTNKLSEDNNNNKYETTSPVDELNIGDNRFTTVTSDARPTTTNLDSFGDLNEAIKGTNSLDTISSGQIVLPTKQPSRELTTPFEMDFMSNLDTDRKRINIFLPSFGAATATPPRFEDFIKKQQNGIQESDLTNKFSEDNNNKYETTSPVGDTNSQNPFQGFNDKLSVNSKPSEQSISEPQPTNAYEDDIYQYNKPSLSQSTSNDQGFVSSPINISQNPDIKQQNSASEGMPTSQPLDNSEIYEYNKPSSGPIISQNQEFNKQIQSISNQPSNKPISQQAFGQHTISQKPLQGFLDKDNLNTPEVFNRQGISTNSEEIYEYNKPTSSLSVATTQRPPKNNIFQFQQKHSTLQTQNQQQLTTGSFTNPSSQKPVFQGFQSSFPQVNPTIATQPNVLSSTLGQSYNEQSDTFKTQTSFSTEPFNSRPSTSFLQSRPTIPSFDQTAVNQPKQPQGSDGSYNYDRPLKPFEQHAPSLFNQNRITQRPQFSTNVGHNKPTSQPGTFQINRITQASFSSFPPNAAASPFNQLPNTFNSRPGSIFVQAFPTLPSLKPQEQPIQQSHSDRNVGEIYQYTKPEESSTKPEKTEENQLKPQFILTLDNKGSSIPSRPHSFAGAETPGPTFASQNPASGSSRPIGSTILGSPCCSHSHSTGLRKPSAISTIKGEQFDINRKPSTFDVSGYRY